MLVLLVFTRRYGCKSIELFLSMVCLKLYARSIINAQDVLYSVLPIVYGGYIILLLGVLVGYFVGEKIPRKMDLFYSFLGFLLFMTAGSIGINYFEPGSVHDATSLKDNEAYMTTGLWTGIVAIVNAVVFLVDLVLTYLGRGLTGPNEAESNEVPYSGNLNS